MDEVKRPNFFIIGAPKCGTTSLARYLGDHPHVFVTTPKEPCYFSRSLTVDRVQRRSKACHRSLEGYLHLFDASTEQHQLRGDATTRNLRCEAALFEIKALVPEARLIVMLSNPAEFIPSWHAQKIHEKQEVEYDLEKAWRLEESRRHGMNLPGTLKATDALFYSQVARLGSQVERLLEIFPRKQVHLIILDDLRENPQSVYARTLEFLGVVDDGRSDFEVHNKRRTSKRGVLSLLGLGKTQASIVGASPQFENELRQYFVDEVEKLERILGRDLRSWKPK
jgi:hypothetical protein